MAGRQLMLLTARGHCPSGPVIGLLGVARCGCGFVGPHHYPDFPVRFALFAGAVLLP